MKNIFKIVFVVALVATTFCTTSCSRRFHAWNSERVNDIEEMYKVQDADSRLYNYEWFYDQYNQIQSTAANVKLLKTEDEKSGTLMVLNSMIAEYNSRASQTRNRAKWMGAGVPSHIELSDVYRED